MSYLWWILISTINTTLFIAFYKTEFLPNLSSIFSVSNLFLETLIRNDLVLQGFYSLAVSVSKVATVGRYYINASVHHIGGIHAAAATWGFVWLLIDVLQHLNHSTRLVLFTTSFPLLFLWLSIILTALPFFRQRLCCAFPICKLFPFRSHLKELFYRAIALAMSEKQIALSRTKLHNRLTLAPIG